MSLLNASKKNLLNGSFGDLSAVGTVLKVALLDDNHTTNIDTQEYFSDVSANEHANGNGYTSGGATLASKAVAADNTDDEGVLDGADTQWTTATIIAKYACIYKDTGNPATSPILCIIDFSVNKYSSGGTFLITWAAEGIVNLG